MSYVVCVKPPDDHPGAVRVFGFFREHYRAAEFCAKVVVAIDAEPLDETSGYAYVMPVRTARVREAIRWATKGEA